MHSHIWWFIRLYNAKVDNYSHFLRKRNLYTALVDKEMRTRYEDKRAIARRLDCITQALLPFTVTDYAKPALVELAKKELCLTKWCSFKAVTANIFQLKNCFPRWKVLLLYLVRFCFLYYLIIPRSLLDIMRDGVLCEIKLYFY